MHVGINCVGSVASVLFSHLKHLLDLPARQINIQLVKELVDFVDVQKAVSVFVRFFERLLHPRETRTLRKTDMRSVSAVSNIDLVSAETKHSDKKKRKLRQRYVIRRGTTCLGFCVS